MAHRQQSKQARGSNLTLKARVIVTGVPVGPTKRVNVLQNLLHVYPGTLGLAYNEQFDAQKCICSSWVLVVSEHFNIVVNDRPLA